MTALAEQHTDLVTTVHQHNAEAKALSRRGPCGTLSAEYAELHTAINDALTFIERWAEPTLVRGA